MVRGTGGHGSGVRLLSVRDVVGIRPVGRRPGKLGHSGVWNRGARELLLKVTLQLQTEGVSSRMVLSQEGLESRRSKGSTRGSEQTRVSWMRLRLWS